MADNKRRKQRELIDYFVKLNKIAPDQWKDDDLILKLARGSMDELFGRAYTPPLYYNVSFFLRDFQKHGPEWHAKMEEYIKNLDNFVKIDPSDPQHAPIFSGIDTILDRIITHAQAKHKKFRVNGIRKAGSLFAGTRVGRPYEADIQLVLDKNVKAGWCRQNFKNVIIEAVKELGRNLGDTMRWSIHGVDPHFMGVCLMMECNEAPFRRTGVLVDLVPVIKGDEQIPNDVLSTEYKTLISKLSAPIDLTKYEVQGVQRSLGFDLSSIDTQVVKHLDEHIKIGYRVAKYLLQNELAFSEPRAKLDPGNSRWHYENTASYSDELVEYLYGYKGIVRSHPVRVILLQLVVHMQGTQAERELTIPALTFVLLDIVCQFAWFSATQKAYPGVALYHPAVRQPENEDDLGKKSKGVMHSLFGATGKAELFLEDTYITDWAVGDVYMRYCLIDAIAPGLKLLNTKLLNHMSQQRHCSPAAIRDKHELINKPNWLLKQYFETIMANKEISDGYPDTSMKTYEIKLENHELAETLDMIVQSRQHRMFEIPFEGMCRSDEIDTALRCHDCAREGCSEKRGDYVEGPRRQTRAQSGGDNKDCVIS